MIKLKDMIKRLQKQKKLLKAILANSPQTQEQRKAIEEAKSHLEKINNLLKSFGENNV